MRLSRAFNPIWILVAVAAIPGVFAGQSPQATADPLKVDVSGVRGGNLIAAVNADPATFNRLIATSGANVLVLDRICADLVHINRSTLELEPSLASSWERSPNGRTFTLHLRRGVRFSDGSPFTADDVIFSLDAIKVAGSNASQADQLSGGGEFPAWVKVDSHTVRLTFPRATGLGLRVLDSIAIVPRARLLKAFQDGTFSKAWLPGTPPEEIVGLGPFRLKEYQRGVRIVLERNPHYWKTDRSGQRLPFLDSITFLVIPDRNAETLRFEAGEIDLMSILSPESYARLRRAGRGIVVHDGGPGLSMDFLWFNLNPPRVVSGRQNVDPAKSAVFQKPAFRRAVSHAINREGISRALLLGLGIGQYGPISSGNRIWYHTGLPRTPFDLTQARRLFAEAGLRDGNGDGTLEIGSTGEPLEITILTARGNAARENTAQVVQSDLRHAGLLVTVQAIPPNELITRILDSTEYEAILFGFFPTDVSPDLQADLWSSSGSNHFWHPSQPQPATSWEARVDALTTQLVTSTDETVRKKLCNEIQEIWARELPAIPTVTPNVLTGWRATIGNIRPSILAPQLLWNAEELTKRNFSGTR